MNAYVVGIKDEDNDEWLADTTLVFAETPYQAVALAHPWRCKEECAVLADGDGEYSDYTVELIEEAQPLANIQAEAKAVGDPVPHLRSIGWYYSHEEKCEGCDTWCDNCNQYNLCPACVLEDTE